MVNVFINAAHSSFSPGNVCCGRDEHSDVMKFARMLCIELERDKNICCEYYPGNCRENCSHSDVVIILHRMSNMKNCNSYGCDVTVQSDADADIQYEAFRLLESLGGPKGFRLKGVHTNTAKNGFGRMERTGSKHTFLFKLGFIDSNKDNKVFDENFVFLAMELSAKIKEVFGGEKYETCA